IVENEEDIFVEEEVTIIKENESIENEEVVFEDILEENKEVTLKFYISQSLTPNESCTLLFNIAFACQLMKHNYSSGQKEGILLEKYRKTKTYPSNLCSAKIQMLHFVSAQKVQIEQYNNNFNYTYTLEEMKEEAVKNYPLPTIVSAIKDYTTRKLNLGTSVKELKQKEVSNIKQKVNEVQKNNSFGSNTNINSDIAECNHFLKNEGWDLLFYFCTRACTRKRDKRNEIDKKFCEQ
ncbi:23131_t:CDS:2, partial [Gigaspora margarita]